MDKPKLYSMPFSRIYLLYVKKLEKKGYPERDVQSIIEWLLGYDQESLNVTLKTDIDVETFIDNAKAFNPLASEIKGNICGVKIETIEDETMKKIRILDKLIDERYKGKKLESLLK